MTEREAIAAANAEKWTREDQARRIARRINPPKPEGNSQRYDNYLKLMQGMSFRAYQGKITKRDLRTIAQANAGDKLRAGRMMLAYLGG